MRGDEARLGAKAANLVALRDSGFPVPRFTVLTTDEYHSFIAAHGLGRTIDDALGLPTVRKGRPRAQTASKASGSSS